MIARLIGCSLLLAAFLPAQGSILGAAGSCAVPQRAASVVQLRRVQPPRMTGFDLPSQKAETILDVKISGYGVVMSEKVAKSSGNRFVDQFALIAARLSPYSGKIVDCQPVPSDLLVHVPYDPNFVQPTPAPTPSHPPTPVPPGETTQPLRMPRVTPITPTGSFALPILERTLPAGIGPSPNAYADGVAYYDLTKSYNYYTPHPVAAVDLNTGRILWRRQARILGGATSRAVLAIQGVLLGAHRTPEFALYALDRNNGRTLFTLSHDSFPAGSIDGVLFIRHGSQRSYEAVDAATGKRLWSSHGGPAGAVNGPPMVYRGVLLQQAAESGAITEDVLYTFDLRNGHSKWSQLSNEAPLGFRDNIIYIDSTWFPERTDYYIPMTIDAVDLNSGKQLDSFTYRPDPAENAIDRYGNSPLVAYVAGGYAYVSVNNKWYRYDADRAVEQAHPYRMGNLAVQAAFENGSLLVTDGGSAYIAQSFPDALVLRKFADGTLRSQIAQREDGTRYVIIGSSLFAFDSAGAPQAVGRVACLSSATLLPWSGRIAVLCGTNGGATTELLYRDRPQRIEPLRIAVQTPPPFHLRIREFAIPRGRGQWSVGPIAPLRNGGMAITLSNQTNNSVAYVSKNGRLRIVPIAPVIPVATPNPNPTPFDFRHPHYTWPPPQPEPNQLVTDKHGTLWFNDIWRPNVISLTPTGRLTTKAFGTASGARNSHAVIRLAATPAGDIWFARSLPSAQIGRIDGTRTFDVPPQYGTPIVFVSASDGAFWFASKNSLTHLTQAGRFLAVTLPPELQDQRTGPPILAAGAGGTIWAAVRNTIYQFSTRGVLGKYTLPDATLWVQSMTAGCDGSLYIGDDSQELVKLNRSGQFEVYDLPFQPTNLSRASDCTLWFLAGNNYPTQSLGTFTFARR